MADECSISLSHLMVNEGLVPSQEEEHKRTCILLKLKQIVAGWVKKVAWQRQLPKEQIAATNATILVYGSYGLGVHSPESDLDVLCVGPFFATLYEDFFIVLRNMIVSRLEVSDVYCVKAAKVPLMRFKYDGISVDLLYSQLKVLTVPDNINVFDPSVLRNIDETSWKSLTGVRTNQRILHLVPNLLNFQSLLRCIKLWAKRRGVYGCLNGFLGGVHLAILAAYVCQNYPNVGLSALVLNFFATFAMWSWPKPVVLQEGIPPVASDTNAELLMPIRLPCSPYEYCHSRITKSTFYKIRSELLRGHGITKDLLKPNFVWGTLFDPFLYSRNYSKFVKILFSAPHKDELEDWVGWGKSRFPYLLQKLEGLQGFVDPNPSEYVDLGAVDPNAVFYWGLNPGRNINIRSVEEDFIRNLSRGYHVIHQKVELSIVQVSELLKTAVLDGTPGKRIKAQWKNLDYHQQWTPLYSQHLPSYFVGHALPVSTNVVPAFCVGHPIVQLPERFPDAGCAMHEENDPNRFV